MAHRIVIARAIVAKRTTYQLIADWEEVDNARELERRDGNAFNNWLDSSESSPRKFYTGE